jgi:hypothetical protein
MTSPSNNPIQPPQTPGTTPPTPPQVNTNTPAPPAPQLSNTPFAKMFPSGATPQELQGFLNNFLRMMIFEFKQADEGWKKAQEHMKKVMQGDDDDT